jgi:uncharacterized membrane protein HdeD (DUF308 family)
MRKGLIVAAVLVIVLGVAALASDGVAPSIVFICWGILLIAAIVFERVRYKTVQQSRPGPGWERTPERFVDEETGKMVTVYIRPQTGERLYVNE